MNEKTKEIARIVDENLRNKDPQIKSESLSVDQIGHIKDFIKAFNNVEKILH